jgi:hypothetical protein
MRASPAPARTARPACPAAAGALRVPRTAAPARGRGLIGCRAEAQGGGAEPEAAAAAAAAAGAAAQQQQQQQPAAPPAQQQQQQQQPAAVPAPDAPVLAKGQGTAIVTGAISVIFGLAYLALVYVMDMRGGEMQPPPPEAFLP